MKKSIDLSPLPLKKNGEYDWENAVGIKLDFTYEDIKGQIEIIKFTKKGNKVKIKYEDRVKSYNYSKIIYCNFYDILDGKNSYRFYPGDEVKGFIILDQILENHQRCYKVKCTTCNGEFLIEQSKLLNSMKPRCKCCNNKGDNLNEQ